MRSSSSCRLNPILETIGDHWTLGIIHELSAGPRRTLDLFGAFTGLSTKTLTARLKMLKKSGLVERKSFPETPPRVEYSLTEKGREVLPVLRALAEVAHKWTVEPDGSEGLPACQACGVERPEPPSQKESSAPVTDGPRPRKRSDVTLLSKKNAVIFFGTAACQAVPLESTSGTPVSNFPSLKSTLASSASFSYLDRIRSSSFSSSSSRSRSAL